MDQAAQGWARRRLWLALGRDGLTRASEDESRQVELCRYMWWVRHLALAIALVAGLRDGEAGRPELLVAIMFVLQLAGYAWSITVPRHGGGVAVLDAVAFMVLSALGLDPRLVMLIAVAALGTAASFRPVPAVAAYLAVLGAVGLMVRRAEGPGTAAVLTAFCLLGGIFMMRTIRLNIGARRAAERDRLVSERVDAVLWEEVPGTDTVKVSPGAERLLGHPVADWARPGFWREIVHPADLPRWALNGPAAPAGGTRPVRLRHADGSWRWLESRTTSVTDRQGRHAFTVGVLLDRTEQVEAEREALAFGHLVASSPIGQVLLTCHHGRAVVEAVNAACQRALGLPGDAVGTVLADHPTPGFAARDLLDRLLADGEGSVEFTGADGRTYQADGHRVEPHVCKIDVIDVTDRVEAGRLLHRQARQDELTGLPNRRAFIEDVAGHLAGRATGGSAEPTALLVLDLDGFREINDSLGHDTGDELLRSVAGRIRAGLGDAELAARLGGDEFALLLPGLTAAAATARGQAVIEAIGAPLEVGDIRLRMRASLGFAVHPVDAVDAEELLRRADTAMQHARSAGTGTQHYDAATHRTGAERVALVGDLHAAITADQLLLHHQPLVALPTGRVVGTEALVRWQHPTLGMIPPDRFIELAEGSGQIKPLTRWVVRQALTDLHGLGDGGRDLEVSVNLSVHNLYEVDFLDWLTGTLTELGLSGERLVVEITESSVMVDPEAAVRRIEGLRDLGVRTWIDDFGTGHSSLARLCRLPVDGVKIDRAFVTGAAASRRDRDVLTHLVGLVRSLGLATVAEGVEHADCLAALRELGCDLAQGFHIARPMPIARFGALLGAGQLQVPRPRTAEPAERAEQVPPPGP